MHPAHASGWWRVPRPVSQLPISHPPVSHPAPPRLCSGVPSRSIFGFFSVPAKAYPWVLLGVWQLLVPGASFLGHLCGVLVRRGGARMVGQAGRQAWGSVCAWRPGPQAACCLAGSLPCCGPLPCLVVQLALVPPPLLGLDLLQMGQLYVWGYLRWALLSSATVQQIERSPLCASCYQRSGFIAATGGSAADPLLPLSRPAGASPETTGSAGSQRAGGLHGAGSGWLQGSWMPFPAQLNPFQPPPPPSPQGIRLGAASCGSAAGVSSSGGIKPQRQQQLQLPPPDPRAAALAAAEARLKAAAGGSRSAPNLPSGSSAS